MGPDGGQAQSLCGPKMSHTSRKSKLPDIIDDSPGYRFLGSAVNVTADGRRAPLMPADNDLRLDDGEGRAPGAAGF
jgi:hypothetical protein